MRNDWRCEIRFKVLSDKLDCNADLSKLDFDQIEGAELDISQMDAAELNDEQLVGVAGGTGSIEDDMPDCDCGGRYRVDFMMGPMYFFTCDKCGGRLIDG